MAAIQVENLETFNFKRLYEDITDRLPGYATPAFLRLCTDIATTGKFFTFSFMKFLRNKTFINIFA